MLIPKKMNEGNKQENVVKEKKKMQHKESTKYEVHKINGGNREAPVKRRKRKSLLQILCSLKR
jgi:hypothetical protein